MVKNINHIGIAVTNLQTARLIYEKMLGMRFGEMEEIPEQGVRILKGILPGTDCILIELLEPINSESKMQKYIEKKGAGFHHICFNSDDIMDDYRKMKDEGFEFTSSGPLPGSEGGRVVFLHPRSTGGMLIELNENK